MSEVASIRFHSVKHCGIFRKNARTASMGGFSEVLDNIYNWFSHGNKLIQNTCTYEAFSVADRNFLETYLVSMTRNDQTGDYLMVMWNRTHDSGDSVYALDSATTVNSVDKNSFNSGSLPPSSIPGYATYFWFIPKLNSMATITFGSPRTGMVAFSYWLESFLKTESRYVKFDGDKLLGYVNGKGDLDPDPELGPRFRHLLQKNPTKRELIAKNRKHIISIVRKIKLSRSDVTVNQFKIWIGMDKNSQVTHEIPLTYEVVHTPTEAELANIFKEHAESKGWEDIGFKFPAKNTFGAEQKEWVSKSFAKCQARIDVDWVVPGQLVLLEKLDNQILLRRDDFISNISMGTTVSSLTEVA